MSGNERIDGKCYVYSAPEDTEGMYGRLDLRSSGGPLIAYAASGRSRVVSEDAAADVVPLYAFERAMDIIQGLTAEYQNLATALAEAKPDSANEVAAHLVGVLDGVHASLQEIGVPPS